MSKTLDTTGPIRNKPSKTNAVSSGASKKFMRETDARIDATIFEEPIFRQMGGLNCVLQMFGEDALKLTLEELNQSVFISQ